MFFDNLEKLCKDNGKKLTPLLGELNISKGAISRWRNGTLPNGETLIKIADYFDCSIDFLVGRSDKSSISNIVDNLTELSEDENILLNEFSKLNNEAQYALLQYLNFMTSQAQNLKNYFDTSEMNA